MTDTDTSITDKDDFPADKAGDAPTQTMQEAEDEQDQKIWDALDNQEETGEPLAADEPAAHKTADDTKKEVAPTDLWAGATDAQRAAFQAAQDRAATLEHANKSEIGRTKTLRRQLSDVTVQLDRVAKSSLPKKDDGDPDGSDHKPNAWDTLATEYPEVAGPVNERLSKIEEAQARRDRELELETEDAKEAHKEAVTKQQELLTKSQPDWLEVATTPDFARWLDDQPRSIRNAATSNATEIVDAIAAGDVIARYKASRSDQGKNSDGPDSSQDTTDNSLAARRKRQLDASRGARPRGSGTIVSGIPEDGSDEELWKAFDKHDAQESAKA